MPGQQKNEQHHYGFVVKKTNILLVNPACQDKRITDDDARQVPIGLYYIAALLIENGYATRILNLADTQDDPLTIFDQSVYDHKPALVGFSVTNPSRINALACAAIFKKKHPDIPVIFGGPGPTFLAEHLFEACPAIDFIVKGEGERTVLELVKALETVKTDSDQPDPFKHIKGLVYKNAGQLVTTQERPCIENLDTLPHPSKYFAFNHLSMSRGCPGKCTFCGSPKFWASKQVRFHSPDWMVEELFEQVKRGIFHFYICDDTFTMDQDRVIRFCNLIIDKKLQITWNAISRVDYINTELLCAMRKAGCIQISFGVESGSSLIRKVLGKPIAQKTIIQAFEQTAAYGILTRAYFIYGSPGETHETIKDSIQLLHKIKPLAAIFYMLVIFPGTHLYQAARNKGLLTDDLWHEKIEDLPWFEIDDHLDFNMVKSFGDQLRSEFYSHLNQFALDLKLVDIKELYPFHADFLSRLALTFSHGEYADDSRVHSRQETAMLLFEKALHYAPEARAFLGMAMLLQKQRLFPKAIQTLTKGLSYFKDHKDLNICMGICLMNMGDFSQALPFFEKFKSFADADHYIQTCRKHL
ncbi:MAG: radical SAM protein [Pseudomonadota bacterium]